MARAALCRTWRAPADSRMAGQTSGQTLWACRELRAGQALLRGSSPRAAVAPISCLGAGFGQRAGREAGAKPRSLQSRQGSN